MPNPSTPASPTSPSGSGPSSVRAIVSLFETSSTSRGTKPAINRSSHARARSPLASPPPPVQSPLFPSSSPSPARIATAATPANSSRNITGPKAVKPTIADRPPPAAPTAASAATSAPPVLLSNHKSVPSPTGPPSTHDSQHAEDYAKTLLRYNAFFRQPQSAKDGPADVRSGMPKKKSYGDLARKNVADTVECHATATSKGTHRDKKDVNAYWLAVRAYLAISDDEIYGGDDSS